MRASRMPHLMRAQQALVGVLGVDGAGISWQQRKRARGRADCAGRRALSAELGKVDAVQLRLRRVTLGPRRKVGEDKRRVAALRAEPALVEPHILPKRVHESAVPCGTKRPQGDLLVWRLLAVLAVGGEALEEQPQQVLPLRRIHLLQAGADVGGGEVGRGHRGGGGGGQRALAGRARRRLVSGKQHGRGARGDRVRAQRGGERARVLLRAPRRVRRQLHRPLGAHGRAGLHGHRLGVGLIAHHHLCTARAAAAAGAGHAMWRRQGWAHAHLVRCGVGVRGAKRQAQEQRGARSWGRWRHADGPCASKKRYTSSSARPSSENKRAHKPNKEEGFRSGHSSKQAASRRPERQSFHGAVEACDLSVRQRKVVC